MNLTHAKPLSDLSSIAGPMFIGCILNWGLYGVLSAQVYCYHLTSPLHGPEWVTKTLVYVLFAIESTQLVLVTRDSFNAYGRGFGDMHVLESMQLELLAVPIFCGITSCIVQAYYARLIMILSGSKLIAGAIAVVAAVQTIAAVITGIRSRVLGHFMALEHDKVTMWGVAIWSCGSAACDIAIAASMTIVLFRRTTGMPETRKIVRKIVRLVVETGCLTAFAAATFLLIFLCTRHNGIYFVTCATSLAKLYSNSLLAILNNRAKLRSAPEESPEGLMLQSIAFAVQSSASQVRTESTSVFVSVA